jgi:uncharacterized Zn finger protein
MPPAKICPHCHYEHHAKREVISKKPRIVRWNYPLQCPECGAQLKQDSPDRVPAADQVKLGV